MTRVADLREKSPPRTASVTPNNEIAVGTPMLTMLPFLSRRFRHTFRRWLLPKQILCRVDRMIILSQPPRPQTRRPALPNFTSIVTVPTTRKTVTTIPAEAIKLCP